MTRRLDLPQDFPIRNFGQGTAVDREGAVYFVSVSHDAEEISVQKRRVEAHDPVE